MHERTLTPFFFLAAYTHAIAAALRGAGKSSVAMLGMVICWCVIRVSYITVMVPLFGVIEVVFSAYPVTWTLSAIIFIIYYFKADWIHHFDRLDAGNKT